jgi:glycosyltransferase involved in cell wall biosynthesis
MKVLYDARWDGPHGIGRFAQEVSYRLPEMSRLESGPKPASVLDPGWLDWQIARVKPQVFFSPGFNPPLLSRTPLVFTIHDLIHLHVPEEASQVKKLYYEHVVRPAASRAATVLTVSQFSKQQLLEWLKLPEERIVVVGNAVSSHYTSSGKQHRPGFPYVFSVLNAKPHKNMLGALEIFHQAKLETNVQLLLSGPPVATVLERAAHLGVSERVVFAGRIAEPDLPAYYRGALAFLFPSFFEGFGIPPLEAMACGTPVVSSNLTSLPEVVADAALSADPRDVEHMAALLTQAVHEPFLQQSLRERGLRQASKFRWDDVAARVLTILTQAANQ